MKNITNKSKLVTEILSKTSMVKEDNRTYDKLCDELTSIKSKAKYCEMIIDRIDKNIKSIFYDESYYKDNNSEKSQEILDLISDIEKLKIKI